MCDRNQDYTYFCRAAIEKYRAEDFPIWIVSDARYGTWGLGEMLEAWKMLIGEGVVGVKKNTV